MIVKFKDMIPGFLIAVVIYLSSYYLSYFFGTELLGYEKSPISNILIAIVIGIIIGNIFNLDQRISLGLNFSLKFILRLGIILMGVRLSLSDIFLYGYSSIPLVVICIISVIIMVIIFGNIFTIPSRLSYLIAVGTSICGASAIIATAPIINAKKAEVTYAIANITIFGIIVMFLYPYLSHHIFDGNSKNIGMFLGTAIHETAQVIASGLIYDQHYRNNNVLEIAAVTKLVRNTFLLLMVPVVFYLSNSRSNNKKFSIIKIFPLFIIGFLFMSFFRSFGDYLIDIYQIENLRNIWIIIIDIIIFFSSVSLGIAMAALGLMTNIKEILKLGVKPFIIGFIAASTAGIVSLFIIKIFFGQI
ncbi:MAG: hypothetical protein CFH01_00674 [Alphaproteobacteria bacterium MarineAlpha2_Bin1]|nr:MAG: hypothetical protein CFH01_00674 [Alphaproteobacteria bacterium MarineAlpha2_Bin1]